MMAAMKTLLIAVAVVGVLGTGFALGLIFDRTTSPTVAQPSATPPCYAYLNGASPLLGSAGHPTPGYVPGVWSGRGVCVPASQVGP